MGADLAAAVVYQAVDTVRNRREEQRLPRLKHSPGVNAECVEDRYPVLDGQCNC